MASLVLASALAWLSGCSWLRGPAPPTDATPSLPAPLPAPVVEPTPAASTPADLARPGSLAAEQRRLAELFRGTPVVFELKPDGSLRVGVPLRFSFDGGRAVVKPPLAAVLDRVARGQRGQKTKLRVAAPADPATPNPRLARERTASTRDYLIARGLSVSRFIASGPASAGSVEIVVAEPAPR